jgi:hypothetical protein
LDTRSKIVTPEEAKHLLEQPVGSRQIAVVAGFFDPLTLEVAQLFHRVAANAQAVAIVLEGRESLLPAQARALLVAALRTVYRVTIAPQDSWRSTLPADFSGILYFDLEEDARRSEAFAGSILRNQTVKRF